LIFDVEKANQRRTGGERGETEREGTGMEKTTEGNESKSPEGPSDF